MCKVTSRRMKSKADPGNNLIICPGQTAVRVLLRLFCYPSSTENVGGRRSVGGLLWKCGLCVCGAPALPLLRLLPPPIHTRSTLRHLAAGCGKARPKTTSPGLVNTKNTDKATWSFCFIRCGGGETICPHVLLQVQLTGRFASISFFF